MINFDDDSPLKSWSLSMLGKYETCAAKIDFQYIKKIKEVTSPQAARGLGTHDLVEKYVKGEAVPLGKGLAPAFPLLQMLREKKAKAEVKLSYTKEWLPTEWNTAWLRAVLDCIEPPEEEGVMVWEWKTGKMYDDHKHQRDLYSVLALIENPNVPKATVTTYYLDSHTSEFTTIERDRLPYHIAAWEERAQSMFRDRIFAPRPGIYCRWCSYAGSKGGPCKFG